MTDNIPVTFENREPVTFEISRSLLRDLLDTADGYTPQYLYGYDWTAGKTWQRCIMDGETIKLVTEEDLDTEMFWSINGPDQDENGKPKLRENAEILELNMEKLMKGLGLWSAWILKRKKMLPNDYNFDYDVDDAFALIQFALWGEVRIG